MLAKICSAVLVQIKGLGGTGLPVRISPPAGFYLSYQREDPYVIY
jgi:hypothetical protein